MNRRIKIALPVLCLGSLLSQIQVDAAVRQLLPGQVPKVVPQLTSLGRLAATNELNLAISLPLRNQAGLSNLLAQLYDPASTNFHRYLTPEQFTEQFGPTAEDYESIKAFARSNHLTVTGPFGNRQVLDVSGKVPEIENTFHVRMHTYHHPTEAGDFYAPDTEPSVDTSVPILEINGLNNYDRAHPFAHPSPAGGGAGNAGGSGPNGYYRGKDFRNAYLPGVTLDGSGQSLGLVEFDRYYTSDITTYETQSGLPSVPLQNVLIDTTSTTPSTNANGVGEVSLDIEMVISMATNLSKLYVFEGPINTTTANWVDMLNAMASSNNILQFSSSWGIGTVIASGDQIFQTMAAQGQSFFQASGDGGAFISAVPWPGDSPYVISVGGTTLTMDATATSYISETVWNTGFLGTNNTWYANGQSGYWASGGGVSTTYAIPPWQLGVNMTAIGGSASQRNLPDVALTASQIWVNYFNGVSGGFIGTSCAAPLWGGFAALVNQQCARDGKPAVGFINPALYALGKNGGSAFHDITTGNSNWSTNLFYSAAGGFDLCTGWGSPSPGLIHELENFAGTVWVDFTFAGTQTGTYANPYNTLALGVANVHVNGTVAIKGPSSTPVSAAITKPLVLNASGGAVTIGH